MASIFVSAVRADKNGENTLDLKISGMKCASCLARVRQTLQNEGIQGHVDLASGVARLHWRGPADLADRLVSRFGAMGFEASLLATPATEEGQGEANSLSLKRCLAVAGLSSVIVMGLGMSLEPSVWVMAAITLFALGYAGRPFFFSALKAVRSGHANMDVPIAVALALTTGMSLFEIAHQGTYAYFDSVVMLLFILLVGRYLDEKTRGQARAAAMDLLALFSGRATIVEGDTRREVAIRDLMPDMILSVAVGEKIAADGVVTLGRSDVDPSLITGETVSVPVEIGTTVFGGMVNLSAPLHVRVTAAADHSLVGEVIRLMEKAQQSHAHFVRLADRVARLYTPAVFGLAALTFLGWWLAGGVEWQRALLITSTVLVITCPCAMGLAVPAVQILASSRLFRRGILLKSGDALEKLSKVRTIVFDKTGTLTLGRPRLANRADMTAQDLKLAASLAVGSRHPLARAVLAAYGDGPVLSLAVKEHPGLGLQSAYEGVRVRLGRREWCGVDQAAADEWPELWLAMDGASPIRFVFRDEPKEDAVKAIAHLGKAGYDIHLLSGDRDVVARAVARQVGIEKARGQMSPTEKNIAIEALRAQGQKVLMVGDGLNDAAALAAADVSMSPSSALDITQNAADLVFQGEKLFPVIEALRVAKKAETLVQQNIALSLAYNIIAVPLAMMGMADPLFAAAAMSLSSITVVLNAQRMRA